MENQIYDLEYSNLYFEHLEKHQRSGQKKILTKIDAFLDELEQHPTTGTGQVEPLKGYDQGNVYSRRIDKKHRLVYEILEESKIVKILSAYGHYED